MASILILVAVHRDGQVSIALHPSMSVLLTLISVSMEEPVMP
jgi:hypothetical protein